MKLTIGSELKNWKLMSAGWWLASNPERLVYESKNYSANLPVLDCELSMPTAMMIMNSTAPASSLKGTMEKVLKCPNRTIGKIFVHLEEMVS